MREKELEEYMRVRVARMGGKAFKFVSPGNDGVPDRIVCLPGGRVFFAEIKAPGKKPRPLQIKQQAGLRELGFTVFGNVDSKEAVDTVLALMGGVAR